MKITKDRLRKIIQEELLREAPEPDVDFNIDDLDMQIPTNLKRLLNPDLTPQKFAQLDAELDASGTPQHQAFALTAFALTYAENKEGEALKILNLAKALLPKISKAMSDNASTSGGE